jgi:uncharacterized protein (TIGR02270 family)
MGKGARRSDYTLAEAVELEELVTAHLDGLVLGGEPVARRQLEPALVADEAERIVVAALALLGSERSAGPAAVLATLPLAEPPVLIALRRAFELATFSVNSTDFASLLKQEDAIPELLVLVLDTLGSHGLVTAPLCMPFLTHPSPQVVAAALRAVSSARLSLDPGVLQRALGSAESQIRDSAIMAGLLGGHRSAWAACQTATETRATGCRLPLMMLGMSGDERDTNRLLGLLSDKALWPDVLWALGFTGRVAAADACLELMRYEPVAALAGEAFSAITGLRIEGQYSAERQEPEAEEPIRLEREELDAALEPKPEDALPLPQADAVSTWWQEARQRLDARQRYLAGQPFTPQVLLDALAYAPMRRRHALALELALRSRGALQVPTRAFVWRQVTAWKQARSAPPSTFGRSFAEGLRG